MKKVIVGLLLSFACTSIAYAAGDINAGEEKSRACAACHGANGISAAPIWPNLAGQKAAYIEKQLKDFQSGVRKDPSMTAMVSTLSPADIVNIAAYYASLK